MGILIENGRGKRNFIRKILDAQMAAGVAVSIPNGTENSEKKNFFFLKKNTRDIITRLMDSSFGLYAARSGRGAALVTSSIHITTPR